jgi:hypothetical protein
MIYLATFYSHFGAIRFVKACKKLGYPAEAMPVPRSLSSSCGTCVRFSTEDIEKLKPFSPEIEKVVRDSGGSFELVYSDK